MGKKTLLEIFKRQPEVFEKYFSKMEINKGDILFREGDKGNEVFFIEKGTVAIKKSMDKNGTDFKILAIVSEGNFFGEMAVLKDIPRTASAEAVEESLIYKISRAGFLEFVNKYPQEGFEIFLQITSISMERLQHTSKELTLLYDISRMLTSDYLDEKIFLKDIVDEVSFYFDNEWNIESFFYNFYNDEYEMAGSNREFESSKKFSNPSQSGWIDDNAYAVVAIEKNKIQAYIIFNSKGELSIAEKNNWATIFNTISFILSSGLKNIAGKKELGFMNKLKNRKNFL